MPDGKGGKGGKLRQSNSFAAHLSTHLETGTRPGLKPGKVGNQWTAPDFGHAVGVNQRTVRNWRSGTTLPSEESLSEVLEALFSDDANLAAERRALEEAWDAAQRLRLERTPQLKVGLQVSRRDDHLALDVAGSSSDSQAATDAELQQQHGVVRAQLDKLHTLVSRRHNRFTPAWDDLKPTLESLIARLAVETSRLPSEMAWLYQDALSLGSLLEQHAQLRDFPEEGDAPLAVDLARQLADSVGAVALLIRGFPSNRERDAQHAMFWEQDAMTPARAVRARARGLLLQEDEALLDRMERTAGRSGIQADKARGGFIATIGNLALAGVTSLMLSGIANESPFIKRVSSFVVAAEEPIARLMGSFPTDMAAAIRYGLRYASEESALLPWPSTRRDPPDMDEVRRMVLAGQVPPAEWVPFIRSLDFDDEATLIDLSPLAELSELTELYLSGTGASDVSSLAGLRRLKALFLSGTNVADISPLSGLGGLETLNLDSTYVTDLSPLSRLNSLTTLSFDGTAVAEIYPLALLDRLEALSLDNTRVSDFSPLSSLANLETLSLDSTGVTDLSRLTRLTRLKRLSLNRTGVREISPFAKSSMLESLSLDGTGVTNVSPLAECKNLRTLSLNRTEITDLSSLSEIRSLEALSLDGNEITELVPIANLSKLEEISLNNTNLTDLSALAKLTSLRKIYLNETSVTDLSELSNLRNLESLHLDGSPIDDLSTLPSLRNLRILSLNRTYVTDFESVGDLIGIEEIFLDDTVLEDLSSLAAFVHLKRLHLSKTRVRNLSPLAGLTKLDMLFLSHTGVTDLSPLAGLSALELLSLDGTRVTDLSPLAGLTRLEMISLDGTEVTDLSPLARLPNLMVFREGQVFLPSRGEVRIRSEVRGRPRSAAGGGGGRRPPSRRNA